MFMKMNPAAFGAALMLFAGTVNADAGLVTYSDFSSWNAAVPSFTLVTIPDPASVPIPDMTILERFGTVTYGGVTFASNIALGNGGLYNIGPIFSGSAVRFRLCLAATECWRREYPDHACGAGKGIRVELRYVRRI